MVGPAVVQCFRKFNQLDFRTSIFGHKRNQSVSRGQFLNESPPLPHRTIPLPLVLAVCAAIVGLWLALGMPLSSGCGPQALPWLIDSRCR